MSRKSKPEQITRTHFNWRLSSENPNSPERSETDVRERLQRVDAAVAWYNGLTVEEQAHVALFTDSVSYEAWDDAAGEDL